MLLACILLIVFAGSIYYNINLMDAATQNMALSSTTQLDRYCRNPDSSYCKASATRINQINDRIKNDLSSGLIMSGGVSSLTTDIQAPGSNTPASPPAGFNWTPGCGWGWAAITMKAPMTFFVSSDSDVAPSGDGLDYTSRALGFTYSKGSSC